MATLGFRTIQEMIGHVEALDTRAAITHWKAKGLDISPILAAPSNPYGQTMHQSVGQDHGLEHALDQQLLVACEPAIERGEPVHLDLAIHNVNRTVGTMLGHAVTQRYGGAGLPDGTIDIRFRGSAGQSFGAFVPSGITLRLEGDANDYVAKGLSGGRVVVRPDRRADVRRRAAHASPATSSATARRAARSFCAAWWASGSVCATRARPRWSRVSATTVAST